MFEDLNDIDFLKLSINSLQKKLKHLFSMLNEDDLDEEDKSRLREQIEEMQTEISDKQSELKKMYKDITTPSSESISR